MPVAPCLYLFNSVLDLKYAFVSILLAPVSEYIFAFEWADPMSIESSQLNWTALS